MRKIILLTIALFMVSIGFSQNKFAEFTMNYHLKQAVTVYDFNYNPIEIENFYDSVLAICDDKNVDYIVHHYYSDDPFLSENALRRSHNLLDRTYDDYGYYMPNGFVMGQNLRQFRSNNEISLVDQNRYDKFLNDNEYSIDSLNAWGKVEYVNVLDPTFKFKIEVFSNVDLSTSTLQTFLIEDVSTIVEKDTLYFKNVERLMIPDYNGIPYSDSMEVSLKWNADKWLIDNCHVVFVLEDENYNVLGYGRYTIQELLDNVGTGISKFDMLSETKIYPNPAINEFNIESTELIKTVEIYSINGSLLYENNNVNSYQFTYDRNDLNSGVYFIKINSVFQKLIIN